MLLAAPIHDTIIVRFRYILLGAVDVAKKAKEMDAMQHQQKSNHFVGTRHSLRQDLTFWVSTKHRSYTFIAAKTM
jgi:trimethylamine:corrinoid methyltransferase-like protein